LSNLKTKTANTTEHANHFSILIRVSRVDSRLIFLLSAEICGEAFLLGAELAGL
jgi:hypothetical protein